MFFKKCTHIFGQWCSSKMVIHKMGALKQLFKVLETNGQANGESNCRPQGVTSAHPIPEAKHVGTVNAKGGHLFLVCGQSHEMFSYRILLEANHIKSEMQPLSRRLVHLHPWRAPAAKPWPMWRS